MRWEACSRRPELVDGPAGPMSVWETDLDQSREVGLDIKYAPTSNLALNVTVNTDFAQVEADSAQVNLERFQLFVPEKRQFFQERSATFDFNTGGPFNRLFYSRKIGLDDGDIVRIYGGVARGGTRRRDRLRAPQHADRRARRAFLREHGRAAGAPAGAEPLLERGRDGHQPARQPRTGQPRLRAGHLAPADRGRVCPAAVGADLR